MALNFKSKSGTKVTKKNGEKELKPVYVIHGEERFLLDQAVERLKVRHFATEAAEFNLSEFRAGETPAAEIVLACQTLPFLLEKRLVLIRDAERLAPLELAVLAKYADEPAESTVLVMVVALPKEKRDREIILGRFRKFFGSKIEISEYKLPGKNEYPHWVRDEFLARGKVATPQAVRYLIDHVGLDLYALLNEIEKICLYYRDRKGLEVEDIENLIRKTLAGNVYDLIDAVAARNLARSLNLLNHFIHEDDEVSKFFYALLKHFRGLLRTKVLKNKGASAYQIGKKLSVQTWLAEKYCRQSENFQLPELKKALAYLHDADTAMKSGGTTGKLAMENLVIKLLAE